MSEEDWTNHHIAIKPRNQGSAFVILVLAIAFGSCGIGALLVALLLSSGLLRGCTLPPWW